MCGIYAAISDVAVTQSLLSGLSLLSYRGYDSAGIAVANSSGIQRKRAEGKLDNLASVVSRSPLEGVVGIGHTRWATHGLPNEKNAHPHMTGEVAVVHNGIVENYTELKASLERDGYHFQSETDSETIAQLLTFNLRQGKGCVEALYDTLSMIKGSYAVAVIFSRDPDSLYVSRKGSPLVVGKTVDGFFVSSDVNALPDSVEETSYLADGQLAVINQKEFYLMDENQYPVEAIFREFDRDTLNTDKGEYQHYMMKEIEEQVSVFDRCWHSYYDATSSSIKMPELNRSLASYSRFNIISCGTSFYAGMVAKYWIEKYAGIPVDLDIASEYCYRNAPIDQNSAALFISQSGETADTLSALKKLKSSGQTCLAMVNVINSTMAREADVVLPTYAGPEIGVASTKAFISQLTALMMLTLSIAKANNQFTEKDELGLYSELKKFRRSLVSVLSLKDEMSRVADNFDNCNSALFIGRGAASAIAFEGALKLKEISYIHAEAYPAGELKHGPLALVDENMPVVVIAPPGELFSKSLSNLREVAARGGKVILVSDAAGVELAKDFIVDSITIPSAHPMMSSILYTIPLQLLSYYCAIRRGNNVDQPRNLAKSVTVE